MSINGDYSISVVGVITYRETNCSGLPGIAQTVSIAFASSATFIVQNDTHPDACVLHTKPSFLPVDIQHNPILQSPSYVQVLWSQNYATEILHCYEVCNVNHAMPSSWIRHARHTHFMS